MNAKRGRGRRRPVWDDSHKEQGESGLSPIPARRAGAITRDAGVPDSAVPLDGKALPPTCAVRLMPIELPVSLHALAARAPYLSARQVQIVQRGQMWMKPDGRALRFTAARRFVVDRVAFSWSARFPLLRAAGDSSRRRIRHRRGVL